MHHRGSPAGELHLTLDDGREQRDVTVTVHRGDATLGDLAASAGWATSELVVDGAPRPVELALADAGVGEGSLVAAPQASRPTSLDASSPALAVTGGLIAGPTVAVGPAGASIGRAATADVQLAHPTVSAAHARVSIDRDGRAWLADLGSTNGTWLGGQALTEPVPLDDGDVARLGAVRVRWVARDRADEALAPPHHGARWPFVRPPRAAPPAPPDPVPAPRAPGAGDLGATPLSVTALVAPLVFAAVLVWALGSWRFALFALLSPVMVLGNWVEGKRRRRRASRGGDRRLRAVVAAFRAQLLAAGAAERRRRAELAPDPAEALRRAVRPSTRLWERRAGDPDHLVVHLGVGEVAWDPPVDGSDLPDAARQAVGDAATLAECPATLALGDGPVALVGDRGAALGVARSLVCQAATHHGPADLALAVVTTGQQVPSWDWAKWLPHALDGSARRRRLATEPTAAGVLADLESDDRPACLVLDLPAGAATLTDAGRLVRSCAGRVTAIVLADDARSVPAWCAAVVELTDGDGSARVHQPRRASVSGPLLVAACDDAVARRWSRALARFRDPEAPGGGTGLPDRVDLAALLPADLTDPGDLVRCWDEESETTALTVGVGAHGAVRLDFALGGPFAVVVGAAGAGKSTLLRSLAAAAAVRAGPDRLGLVLWSAGADATFAPLEALPHVAAAATGAGPRGKLLEGLRGELQRRAGDAAGTHPHLLVLVDDADTLAGHADPTLDELAGLAGRGAALGVSVVVAARRWAGPVARAAATVPGPRVALRTGSQADALAVAGRADPTTFERHLPGRAVAAHDDQWAVVQVARAGADAAPEMVALTLSAFDFEPVPSPALPGPGAERAALQRLVQATRATGRAPAAPLLADHRAGVADASTLTLADLLGEDPATVDPKRWSQRPAERTLVTTLGTTGDGARFTLDLREAAQGGDGPHGMLIGATGSGKSELLRTILAGLVADHSPQELALVLVDFKGGATFAPMADLPHVAGVITNLADDLAMIDRMQAALEGELRRRQQLLHDAGDLPSVRAYDQARRRGADLQPLPALLLVVDEFSELLATRPEFIDVLGAIGRVGRSLAVHLLLASQRLEEGRLRGLDSHLRYRIALRTFNAADSRAVLGTPDASRLPPVPGAGYVKLDDELARIESAYVSAEATEDGRTQLDLLVERLRDAAGKVHQVWLPPLPPVIALGELVGGLVADARRGLVAPNWPGVGRLGAPVGVVDRPEDQTQSVHALDLSGAAGNVAIVGAPQTGKSTALRTLLCGLALTHTPTEVQVYAVDHGGGGLDALADLPHVGAVAGRRDVELIPRIVRHVQAILALREQRFAELGIDSAATLRARRAAGALTDEVFGDVILAIDGWASLRQAMPELEPAVTDLATRGLGFGVHVVLTANRWVELRPALRDGFGGAIELRLTDPIESSVDRRSAATVPIDRPGRGLSPDGHHLQVALPRVDGRRDGEVAAGLRDLVGRVAAAWHGPAAPPVRLLPEKVTFADLPAPGHDPEPGVPIGVSEIGLAPLYVDLHGADPHLLVFGDGGSGKTSVLATLLTGLVARCSPEQARVVVVDYRRTLLEVVPDSHLLAYAGAGPAAAENAGRLRDTLFKRTPGPDVTAAELRRRSWWSGPELYLVVDDYDLVVNPSGNPLAPLTEFLAQGRDLGFHVVLARRSAGTNRSFEPFLQRLRELGGPGLLLSGDPQEGPLLRGVRAQGQPPGRGTMVRRDTSPALVQTAWIPT